MEHIVPVIIRQQKGFRLTTKVIFIFIYVNA